jgi:PAS domain S-box-containing protein
VAGWSAIRVAGAADVIRYGGAADFPPFESLDAQGRPTGFQVELLHALAGLMQVEFLVTLGPWAQTEAAFRAGRLDLIAMVDTAERRTWARFMHSHATPAFAVYHRQGQPDPQVITALAGQRVAVLSSAAMHDTVQTALAPLQSTLVVIDSPLQALRAVQTGQVDAALLPRAYGDRALAEAALTDVLASTLSFPLQAYAFAVAPGRDDLAGQLQSALQALEGNGRLEALRLRWLSSHHDRAEQQRMQQGLRRQRAWTLGVAGASTVALALLGTLVWRRGRSVASEHGARRDAEAALSRAEALLSRTFTLNPEPMLIVDRNGGVVRDANDALLGLLGVAASQFVGHALADQAQHVESQVLEHLVAVLDSDGVLVAAPLRLTRADGQARECLVSADRLTIDGTSQVFCIVRDITEPLQRDAGLRQGYDALKAELEAMRREAAGARQGLVQAESALQDFTRAVSHDLRTPLNAVQGFNGLLRMRLQDGHVQEALDCSEHIERAAHRMNTMIGALSGLSQVSRQPLRRAAVDMARLARDTVTLLAAAQPQHRVACRIETLPVAQADPDLVAQVWQNLLDNAWKYSAKASTPRVLVDCRHDERGTWYRVTDNGAGFDMARASLLFVPFQRLHSESQFAGTGVGLSVVRRIIDLHQGEIHLRSTPGVGTVAEFTLDPPPGVVRSRAESRDGCAGSLPTRSTTASTCASRSRGRRGGQRFSRTSSSIQLGQWRSPLRWPSRSTTVCDAGSISRICPCRPCA